VGFDGRVGGVLTLNPPVIIHLLKLCDGDGHKTAVLGGKFYRACDHIYFCDFPRFATVVDSHSFLRKVALLLAVEVVFVEQAA
jgi:hypothetical protein